MAASSFWFRRPCAVDLGRPRLLSAFGQAGGTKARTRLVWMMPSAHGGDAEAELCRLRLVACRARVRRWVEAESRKKKWFELWSSYRQTTDSEGVKVLTWHQHHQLNLSDLLTINALDFYFLCNWEYIFILFLGNRRAGASTEIKQDLYL